MAVVLIADDDPVQRRHLQKAVNALGHRTIYAHDGDEVLSILRSANGCDVSAIFLDVVMPNLDGMGTLAVMREEGLMRPTIACIAPQAVDQVGSVMRAGAVDFCLKPGRFERIRVALAGALERAALSSAVRLTASNASPILDDLCAGPAMEHAMQAARRAAAGKTHVLLEGEAGVGKTTLARAIHGSGAFATRPLHTLNAAALDGAESLVQVLGGLSVEDALYLRCVQMLEDDAQIALRDMLSNNQPMPRLLLGADGDMLARVRAGQFREDLYYRLSVMSVSLPPLRKRSQEIGDIAHALVARLSLEEGRGSVPRLSSSVLQVLEKQAWPGNLRQLEAVLLRAIHLCEGDVFELSHFPSLVATQAGEPFTEPQAAQLTAHFALLPMLDDDGAVCSLDDMEERLIRFALNQHNGRMSAAARALGIGRSTLYRKLEALGIDPASPDTVVATGRRVD